MADMNPRLQAAEDQHQAFLRESRVAIDAILAIDVRSARRSWWRRILRRP